jgi:MFS family permease
LKGAADWKIWAFAMLFFDTTTISYALAYFAPDILKYQLHYSPSMTQVMGAPPYVFAGVIMFLTGWLGDKYKIRGPIIIFNMLLCVAGLPLIGWTKIASVRYFGLFLVTAGANANVPTVMTYQVNYTLLHRNPTNQKIGK